MATSHHIGLEIAERSFRFVEIQKQDRQTTILRADTIETAYDYSSPLLFDIPYDKELARSFITDLATVYHRHTVFAGSLSLVLPAMLPLVCTLPLDKNMSPRERKEHLQWECRTLGGFPDHTQLSILSHDLASTRFADQMLVVALPQPTVDFLTQTCDYLTLELHAIDIDHFVMEKMIQHQYPHDAESNYAVLGLHEAQCSAGRYNGKHYHGCRTASITYKQHYPAQAVRLLESLPSSSTAGALDQVYVFGSAAESRLTDSIEGILKCGLTRCIPLAETTIPDDIQNTFQRTGERMFDAAAAAGLLGLV
jgi:Tfp pilus assembly PilM family ATPase